MSEHTKITSDGGLTEQYPDDTLRALTAAVDAGADRLELDVHASADGQLVIHHPYLLGENDMAPQYPATGHEVPASDRAVFELPYAELERLDAGGWYSPEFAGERMPRLEEVLEATGKRIEYEIDLKGDLDQQALLRVIELVESRDLFAATEFTSSEHFILAAVRQLRPDARIGFFEYAYPGWTPISIGQQLTRKRLQLGKVNVCHGELAIFTPEFVKQLQAEGYLVHGSQCNTKDDLRRAFELGLDQLSTTTLQLALKIRASAWGAE